MPTVQNLSTKLWISRTKNTNPTGFSFPTHQLLVHGSSHLFRCRNSNLLKEKFGGLKCTSNFIIPILIWKDVHYNIKWENIGIEYRAHATCFQKMCVSMWWRNTGSFPITLSFRRLCYTQKSCSKFITFVPLGVPYRLTMTLLWCIRCSSPLRNVNLPYPYCHFWWCNRTSHTVSIHFNLSFFLVIIKNIIFKNWKSGHTLSYIIHSNIKNINNKAASNESYHSLLTELNLNWTLFNIIRPWWRKRCQKLNRRHMMRCMIGWTQREEIKICIDQAGKDMQQDWVIKDVLLSEESMLKR